MSPRLRRPPGDPDDASGRVGLLGAGAGDLRDAARHYDRPEWRPLTGRDHSRDLVEHGRGLHRDPRQQRNVLGSEPAIGISRAGLCVGLTGLRGATCGPAGPDGDVVISAA
jgi:hypothetical protein